MNRRQFNGSLLQTNNLSTIVPHRDCQFRRSRRSARSMSYEDALLRATQKPPHSDSYHSSGYPEVLKILGKFLDGTPHVRTFDVVGSTLQKVANHVAA